jgi:hypothetical protein
MKKGICITFLLLIASTIFLIFYSKEKITSYEYYSPLEGKAYIYDSEREISFDVYSFDKNSLIKNPELNIYTLKLDQTSIVLDSIRCNTFDFKDYSIIRIYAKMPKMIEDEYYSKESILEIKNQKFILTLKYGAFSILNPISYSLLSISNLYGTYTYMNQSLILSGINITLTKDYEYMSSLRIGNACYGILSKALFDTKLDNICDLNKIYDSYNPSYVEESNIIHLSSNTLFIPLGYRNINLIRMGYIVITVDTKTYYIDTFDFMTNMYDFNEYKNMMEKGGISYA